MSKVSELNADELKVALRGYYDNQGKVGVCVYALVKDSGNPGPFKLDIEGEAQGDLKALFMKSINEEILSKDGLSVMNLSSADDRAGSIYAYDLDPPEELSSLELVVRKDDLPVLDLKCRKLSSISALLIEIGNDEGQLVLYKTLAPVNVFCRSSFFLVKSKSRLEKLDEEFVRISSGFQMMRVNGELFVFDLEALERSFGFHEVIKREARLGVESIVSAGLLVNPEVLKERIDEEIKYARRLTRVAKASPVIKEGISGKSIVGFCKSFPNLIGKIRFSEDETQIVLDTKVSMDLFIKLLMDDFLTSELTRLHYASIAKDAVVLDCEA